MEEVDNAMNERMEKSVEKQAEEAERALVQIKECIKTKDIVGLQKMILDQKSLDKMIYWDICTDLIECLTQYTFDEYPEFFDICEKCMHYVVKNGNAKETLLIILENLDRFNDDTRYKTLLQLLQPTMLRVPKKMKYALDLALSTVTAHLLELKIPDDYQLEGDEKKLLDVDPDVLRITDCVKAFLHFVKPFVEALSLKNASNTQQEMESQIRLILKELLKILDHPLAFMDLSYNNKEGKTKSSVRVCAEVTVQYICKLKPDIHKLIIQCLEHNQLLKRKSSDYKQADETVSVLSLACLAYLVNVEYVCIDYMVGVFSPEFKLDFYLQFISCLIARQESLLLSKGVHLLQKIVDMLSVLVLPSSLLENSSYTELIDRLISVTIFCPVNEIRLLTLRVITSLSMGFSLEGRYQIMMYILSSCNHSGFKGYTIQLLKEQIDSNLKAGTPSEFFTGKSLHKLLNVAVFLPDGPATDLLENSDQIIATLNLIRYLVIRDPPIKNISGIWCFISELEEKFFEPLQKGIDMSKGHYDLELNRVRKGKGDCEPDVEFSITVAGESMDSMSKEQKMSVLKNAINTFDMMYSILCRVNELLDAQKKSRQQLTE